MSSEEKIVKDVWEGERERDEEQLGKVGGNAYVGI